LLLILCFSHWHRVAIFSDATAKSGANVAPNVYSNPAEMLGIDTDYWDVSVDGTGRIAVVGAGNAVIAMDTAKGEVMWFNTSAHQPPTLLRYHTMELTSSLADMF